MARSVPYCIGYFKLNWLAVNQYFLNAGFVGAFVQEDFDEDFDKAVNEMTASGGIYNCIECKKTYKTLGGLQRDITKQDIRKTSLFIYLFTKIVYIYTGLSI